MEKLYIFASGIKEQTRVVTDQNQAINISIENPEYPVDIYIKEDTSYVFTFSYYQGGILYHSV